MRNTLVTASPPILSFVPSPAGSPQRTSVPDWSAMSRCPVHRSSLVASGSRLPASWREGGGGVAWGESCCIALLFLATLFNRAHHPCNRLRHWFWLAALHCLDRRAQ